MRFRKQYGQSRIDRCPFCNKQAISKNEQNIPVCAAHKKALLGEMKCACGDYLDIMEGKYGAFFLCIKCGPISPAKAFGINDVKDVSKESQEQESTPQKKTYSNKPKEIFITSDDAYYFS